MREPKTESDDIVVGKDILELLSSSMYLDPLSIYREYVQNSADAIDEALRRKIIDARHDGRIDIRIDHINRRVQIRDNGIGLGKSHFVRILKSFGASQKRGTDARGFRGVGRLAGLGYSQKLVFRSRTSKDEPVMELSWDGRLLQRLLNDPDYTGNLNEIVQSVTEVTEYDDNDAPERFFEVDLNRVRRIGRDILLNEKSIRDYLAEVGPVPFSEEFGLKAAIEEVFDKENVSVPTFQIYLNDEENAITRPFRELIEYNDTKHGDFDSVQPIAISGQNQEPLAVGWIAHHDYQGAIPSNCGIRGLRARVGNIQVGGDRLFLDIFPEERFNSWTVGEIHVIDDRIMPNGRRDGFDQSPQLAHLLNHLSPYGMQIARHCRVSSQKRNRLKSVELGISKIDNSLIFLRQGALSKLKEKQILGDIGSKLNEVRESAKFDLFEEPIQKDLKHKVSAIEDEIKKFSLKEISDDPLADLKPQKRAAYNEFFDLIYECAENRPVAKALIDRILARLKTV